MYELVDSAEKLVAFNDIWKNTWKEKGYEIEEIASDSQQFLFFSKGQPVGTLELKPVNTGIYEVFPFYYHRDFIGHKVYEIDKMSIMKEHRGGGVLPEMVSLICRFGERKQLTSFIALTEPLLYTVLKREFKLPVKQLGAKFWYKGDFVVPMSVRNQDIPNFKEKKWYIEQKDIVVV